MRNRYAILFGLVLAASAGVVRSQAQVVTQATDIKTTTSGPGALDDAGTVLFSGSTADFAGENPDHAFQIVSFDPVTGAATPITSFPGGTAAIVSVSDDGQWLAFPTVADLTGQNADESLELFVMRDDGSQTMQLTNDPLPNAGSVGAVALSGDGTRIAFVSNSDLTGGNPLRIEQLFVVERDGTGLTQRTDAASGGFGGVSISDDGTRIAFAHDGDLAGVNPDLSSEIYAIDADGTSGPRQLTDVPLDFFAGGAALSGNGARIAFQSDADLTGGNLVNQTEIFVVDWDGSGLDQLTQTSLVIGITGDPASQFPAITDDGQTVFYNSNQSSLFPALNVDGNFEIFRIGADGTGRTVLTNTILDGGSLLPVVSGDGSRVSYYGVGFAISLEAIDGSGANPVTLQTFDAIQNGQPDVTPDGARAVFVQADGFFGAAEIWRVERDGGAPVQVTTLGAAGTTSPSVSADGATIVFASNADPLAINGDLSDEIFVADADGSSLDQLTLGPLGTSSSNPVLSEDGSTIVFESDADLVGLNADGSREIFAMNVDGSALAQLTDGALDTQSRLPRVDASGTWIVFESNADLDGTSATAVPFEIFRIRSDGTNLAAITPGAAVNARRPDISADGSDVVFEWSADPLGTNADLGSEVFTWNAGTATLSQLTSFADGSSGAPRITGDGQVVVFGSDAPVFEDDPDRPADLYRIPLAGGPIERIGALRRGAPVALGGAGGGTGTAVGENGDVVVFSGIGDFTEGNPDGLPEIWIVDRARGRALDVSKGSPTLLRFTHESGPIRYDVVRGSVANLAFGGPGTVDLGAVVCLENDSPDADTEDGPDAATPAPGEIFFFATRGQVGIDDGPGSYGTSSDGRERGASSGDCAP